ncbi:hypothetical protein DFP94_10735 [Fontibacillus phaseoli]|uniref:DUF2798 domain-containing protein n=1 Tax=Fontibacillus phaseoli TaxID=1416533 RepID=A0A369B973_9BACL|nr:DUF2798 domain-containing protein [Fontibacillus phaseoli]RCX18082.1 hypothetical protein DFP94_10735 [Fontibacillus phaseoli]
MPTTKKESFYFGMMMCFFMVTMMTIYNLLLNGLIGRIGWSTITVEFLIGFMIALALDLFIVGPAAKKVAFKLPINKSKKLHVILAISTCMVLVMAFFMSFYGLATSILGHGHLEDPIIKSYILIFLKNFAVAYPLQVLLAGPVVRSLFTTWQNKQANSY